LDNTKAFTVLVYIKFSKKCLKKSSLKGLKAIKKKVIKAIKESSGGPVEEDTKAINK